MSDENKFNLLYFEGCSMKELFDTMENWQITTKKRLLSTNIQKDKGKFCCIALSNPTEVVICNGSGETQAKVTGGNLDVRIHGFFA